MADKKHKSQAEKAASTARAKTTQSGKSTATKTTQKSKNKQTAIKSPGVPIRVISSIIFLCLFILFLLIAVLPKGIFTNFIREVYCGLFGEVVFYISIPGFLYLFLMHAFSGKRPIIMRTTCLICFILICGCLSHYIYDPQGIPSGFAAVSELYQTGKTADSAGVICGLLAMLFELLFKVAFSCVILVIAGILTLLGSMQITIPSIIRAIQNRPRADWEEEKEPRPEPAELVVNHIAKKQIEYKENKRIRQEAAATRSEEVSKPNENDRVSDMMRQIDVDVETPVAAAAHPVAMDVQEPVQKSAPIQPVTEAISEEDILTGEVFEEPVEVVPQHIPVEQPKQEKVTAEDAEQSAAEVAMEIAAAEAVEKPVYSYPPIELLRLPGRGAADGTAEMRENTQRLNETLASFKIEAHIINVTRGPSVTRYEVELEKGVRLSKLTTAADDIALSLGATGVRIAAVPGKISVVGIEVPNRAVTTVSLREVIDSEAFNDAKSKSSFAVGKDIGGNCIVGDISKLPHMLIAGTTGSGKSVCMNSIIISLLYKASPDDVKLIMVDPKMVELGIYNGIPHLLIPVVTDPKKAAGSLQWAVTEMMRRYKAMSDAGVRDLESYNSIIESQEVDGAKLPQVVVIIDELADLMLVAAKEVEESICRIAQMGRAAGIHLIIATQRPSADVITGLMKANIPSRIAFAVASAMESRIILDTQGAEKLVGRGDMLYAPIGKGKPQRVQGCFVSDPEVEAVANHVKSKFTTSYDQQVIEEIERKASQAEKKASPTEAEANGDELAGDEMLPQAVDVILETGQASVSMLQRRLKLGYARAARIVDEMEERGIVGPFQGSKPRAILVTKEQWEQMRSGQSSQMELEDLSDDATISDGV